jgi:hypothetical protein
MSDSHQSLVVVLGARADEAQILPTLQKNVPMFNDEEYEQLKQVD